MRSHQSLHAYVWKWIPMKECLFGAKYILEHSRDLSVNSSGCQTRLSRAGWSWDAEPVARRFVQQLNVHT